MFIWLAILALIGIGIFWGIGVYNSLIPLKERSENAWSDIDVQLKRRHDIIPNLVATVEGYAKHEKTTLQSVTEARAKAVNASGVSAKGEAENMLTATLKSLFAIVENYPQLKANEGFLKLQDSLTEIEDTIQNARRYYNAVVRDFNIQIQIFPNNVIAGMLQFTKKDFFQLDVPEEERKAPQVKFQ